MNSPDTEPAAPLDAQATKGTPFVEAPTDAGPPASYWADFARFCSLENIASAREAAKDLAEGREPDAKGDASRLWRQYCVGRGEPERLPTLEECEIMQEGMVGEYCKKYACNASDAERDILEHLKKREIARKLKRLASAAKETFEKPHAEEPAKKKKKTKTQ